MWSWDECKHAQNDACRDGCSSPLSLSIMEETWCNSEEEDTEKQDEAGGLQLEEGDGLHQDQQGPNH